MAVGGLAVPDAALPGIRRDLASLRAEHGNPREVKWSTTKDRRKCPQTAFANYFVDAVKSKQIHFHIRFAPFNEYNHRASGPNRRSDTTSKMHFQLLLHRALRFYGKHHYLRISPDNGDCTKALPDQIGNLHHLSGIKYDTPWDCIDSIKCQNSEREPLLQLLDVPLGALTAIRNGRSLSPAKQKLASHIASMWPNVNLAGNSPEGAIAFNVWNVKPKPRRDPWG